LRSWREYYCDTEDGWHDCARYQVTLTGKPVPITLLPNGRDAHHLKRPVENDWQHGQETGPPTGQPTGQGLPGYPGSGSPEPGAVFEPAPFPARDPSPRPARVPSPPKTPHAPAKRSFWARVADWMKGPA